MIYRKYVIIYLKYCPCRLLAFILGFLKLKVSRKHKFKFYSNYFICNLYITYTAN